MCNTLHSSWGLFSCLKESWWLTSHLSGVAGGNRLKETGINELLDLPGEQGNVPNRRKGKERFEVHRQRQCSVGNKKVLNINDEITIVSNAQTHPSKIPFLCSKICWTACLVTARTHLPFFAFLFPFPPLLQFLLHRLLNVITKNHAPVKQNQIQMYLQCQLAKHTLQ